MSQQERLADLLKQADEHSASRCITDYDEAIADNAAFLLENGVTILPAKVGDTVYLVLWSHVVSAKVEYILSSITESEIAHQMYVVIIDGYHAGEKKTAMLHDDPNVENHNVCKAYKDRETAEKVCEEIRFATATTTRDERHPNKTGWAGFCNGY